MHPISLVEDDARTRDAYAAIFRGTPGFRCASVHESAEDALAHFKPAKHHVLLVDIGLPGLSGTELVAQLKARHPGLLVLMLTVYESADAVFRALAAGAHGYLLKRTPAAEVVAAIHELLAGGAPMTPAIARKVIQHFHHQPGRAPQGKSSECDGLTPREFDVLDQLAKGDSYKEIGAALDIETGTVSAHLRRIYDKLHVRSATAAVAKYLRR